MYHYTKLYLYYSNCVNLHSSYSTNVFLHNDIKTDVNVFWSCLDKFKALCYLTTNANVITIKFESSNLCENTRAV